MTRALRRILHYVILIAITLAAAAVMWWTSSRGGVSEVKNTPAPLPAAAQPKALVTVEQVAPEMTEITAKYSGKVRAWETYSVGFETGGRIEELGKNAAGEMLDVGDHVEQGQLLARLDDRVLRARRAEAIAQYERTQSDLRRARELRELGGQAITDAEYEEFLAARDMAKAQQEIAEENLRDAVITAPVSGVISQRMAEPGETIGANQVIFDIVQIDDVLLVVDVPESRVRELEMRMRQTREARSQGVTDPEETTFRAHVKLEGRDAFGRPWPPIDAQVFRIAQVADRMTGLFEVEVRIPNPEGMLRPGMVASAEIVTRRLMAYRLPEIAVVFRGRQSYIFSLREEPAPMQVMFWPVGQTAVYRAHRVDLDDWIEQAGQIVVPANSAELATIVVRGQQRLAEDQMVRVTNPKALTQTNRVAKTGTP